MTFVRRLRIRARLAASFAVVLGLLGVVVGIGVVALHRQSDSAQRLRDLQVLMHQVDEQKFRDADISGWQVASAWDAYRIGAKKAADPASDNRAGFLASAGELRTLLGATRTDLMTDTERALFAQMTEQWTKYFEADNQAVAAFAANRIDAGNAVVLGPGYEIYFTIVQLTDELVKSVTARTDRTAVDAQNSASAARTAMVVGLLLAVLAAVLLVALVTRSVTGPIGRVTHALRGLAEGDLAVRIGDTAPDEVGDMARTAEAAADGVRATVVTISDDARALAAAADTLYRVSGQIDGAVLTAYEQADRVAGTAGGVSGNVQTVAAGTEQMGASISEISRNAADAAGVAAGAVSAARDTSATINRLGDSSAEIGSVIGTIQAIAAQTNLLALNATIEAARAGELGKGFAVVASEVKDLAQETARATEEISQRIVAIQNDTGEAVAAIDGISQIIQQISDYQTTIASAVEEQSATTTEMNRGVTEAADGANDIARGISAVAQSTAASRESVAEATRAAGEVNALADRLRAAVNRFSV
ncbi:chemotaxis protein [Paractinoplanes abujensis]|uniref:Methyl-accepting chemotaxis protein n=1 Tax=Paractinoplanes abujensis TaxID=882441 RepID=A0A7W7CNS2_9ACTN|nr:methyl-accepting chemotaxis protein [Actinoplanes abujensis]MBB4691937.1 methyl-accepting chemotaxis protein [Actinoplanes abujensis]GID16644.1 chemotaxis protein [Actinoplanes abujensis]